MTSFPLRGSRRLLLFELVSIDSNFRMFQKQERKVKRGFIPTICCCRANASACQLVPTCLWRVYLQRITALGPHLSHGMLPVVEGVGWFWARRAFRGDWACKVCAQPCSTWPGASGAFDPRMSIDRLPAVAECRLPERRDLAWMTTQSPRSGASAAILAEPRR